MGKQILRRPSYVGIQYLRALAALMVVFHHARNPEPWLYNPIAHLSFGANGVDVFFVISGFIMYSAARDEPALEFIRRRVVRIVPLYWIATFAKLALSVVILGHPLVWSVVKDVALSLGFIPHVAVGRPDPLLPYLVPGWTLIVEMIFYGAFAVALFFRRITLITLAIVFALVIIGLSAPASAELLKTYTTPRMLEFAAGLLIANIATRRSLARMWPLAPLGLVGLVVTDLYPLPLWLSAGIPSAMLVAGVVGLEQAGRVPTWKAGKLVGDASYSIYLFHLFALVAVALVVQHLHGLKGPVQFMMVVGLGLVASTVGGIIVHRLLEKPLLRVLSWPPKT